ncbi:metallophosphoesterase [Paenibacillus sp. CC-CFT747]|nr:metallophosphoesterase [Paenibacillus sp. CC-CFT747]
MELVWIAAAVGLAAVLLYMLFIFPTQWVKVEKVAYPWPLGIKALQISDLHVEKLRVSPRRLEEIVRREKPDYVLLTGDYTEKARMLPKVERYVKAATCLGVPAYAVLGNHDHHLDPPALRRLVSILEDAGVQVLSNRSVEADGFRIVGIDDYGSGKSKVGKAFRDVKPGEPVLVLTHNPNVLLGIRQKYNFLMGGHFHGMQFHVPFLFRYIRKGTLPKRGIYKGLHEGENGAFYISKGIGQAGPNARFLLRSEVTVHEWPGTSGTKP